MTRFLLLVVLSCGSIGLVACGASSAPTLTNRVVGGSEWRAVLRDWYHGRISEHHSCGAVVVASSHLPVDGPVYSTIAADLARTAARVCTHTRDLGAVKVGMSDADVAILAGAPAIPASGTCWDYWSKNRGTTGTAICFKRGRVIGKSQVHPATSHYPSCALKTLRASVGLQGATGSMLGGLSVRNPGPSCTFAGPPVVQFRWHGRQVTPVRKPFDARSLRSMGPFQSSRSLLHGKSLFVWLQWLNYCGAKPWGDGGFRPVAILRIRNEPGLLSVRFRELIVPPFCNSPRYARLSVSDFGVTP